MFHSPRRLIVVLCCVFTLLVGCAALHERQGQWIFNPTDRSWGNTAEQASLLDEAWVEFDSKITGQRVKLHVLLNGQDQDKPVLLYLHGARWNVAGSVWRIQRMRELGFNVVAVDYRGFGKSSAESPSEDKAYEDAEQTWHWIAQKYPRQPRYIFGHSLGGAIAIELATRVDDEKGTLVEGTFTNIPDVVSTMRWGWLPVNGLITQRFDSEKKVTRIGSPLLVVHGSADQLIAPALGQRLYAAAQQPKRFILVEGGSHHNTNGIGQPQYRAALQDMFGL